MRRDPAASCMHGCVLLRPPPTPLPPFPACMACSGCHVRSITGHQHCMYQVCIVAWRACSGISVMGLCCAAAHPYRPHSRRDHAVAAAHPAAPIPGVHGTFKTPCDATGGCCTGIWLQGWDPGVERGPPPPPHGAAGECWAVRRTRMWKGAPHGPAYPGDINLAISCMHLPHPSCWMHASRALAVRLNILGRSVT